MNRTFKKVMTHCTCYVVEKDRCQVIVPCLQFLYVKSMHVLASTCFYVPLFYKYITYVIGVCVEEDRKRSDWARFLSDL